MPVLARAGQAKFELMAKENRILLTRVPGEGTMLAVTIHLELDSSIPEHLERLGNLLRDLIPEEDRDAFLDDLSQSAVAAGILASTNPG